MTSSSATHPPGRQRRQVISADCVSCSSMLKRAVLGNETFTGLTIVKFYWLFRARRSKLSCKSGFCRSWGRPSLFVCVENSDLHAPVMRRWAVFQFTGLMLLNTDAKHVERAPPATGPFLLVATWMLLVTSGPRLTRLLMTIPHRSKRDNRWSPSNSFCISQKGRPPGWRLVRGWRSA